MRWFCGPQRATGLKFCSYADGSALAISERLWREDMGVKGHKQQDVEDCCALACEEWLRPSSRRANASAVASVLLLSGRALAPIGEQRTDARSPCPEFGAPPGASRTRGLPGPSRACVWGQRRSSPIYRVPGAKGQGQDSPRFVADYLAA